MVILAYFDWRSDDDASVIYIPGYPWIKHKIGTFIYSPIYAMTPTQLRAYQIAEA
jgi:hypothetical protein